MRISRRSVRSNDVKRAARLASAIHEMVDVVLADALLSLAYAADLGDPEGAAMLARNVALRHDFGFGRKDADVRARIALGRSQAGFSAGRSVARHRIGARPGHGDGVADAAADQPRSASPMRRVCRRTNGKRSRSA